MSSVEIVSWSTELGEFFDEFFENDEYEDVVRQYWKQTMDLRLARSIVNNAGSGFPITGLHPILT
jgi:hypothetical protein